MSIHITVGQSGMGKTHVSTHYANSCVKEGKRVLFFTGEHAPQDLHNTFHLSRNVNIFQYESLTIETLKNLLAEDNYDCVIIDCIRSLLTDSDSMAYYYNYYKDIYLRLELLSLKEKVDVYFTRQLPYQDKRTAFSVENLEEWENRASSITLLTGCRLVEECILCIKAKELLTNESLEIMQIMSWKV